MWIFSNIHPTNSGQQFNDLHTMLELEVQKGGRGQIAILLSAGTERCHRLYSKNLLDLGIACGLYAYSFASEDMRHWIRP